MLIWANRILGVLVASLAITSGAHATDTCIHTVSPHPVVIQQPNGESVTVHAKGSASNLWFVDQEGLPAVLREGVLFYGVLNHRGRLVATSHPVSNDKAPPKEIIPLLGPVSMAQRATGTVNGRSLHPMLSGPTKRLPPAPTKSAATTGTVNNLVILMRFSDHGPAGQNRTLPSGPDVDTIMNTVGGDPVLAPTGSVRDLYLENSYGLLTLDSTVVGWIDVPNTEVYYANNNSGLTSRTWDLITAALNGADPLVDFSNFDQDGDNVIDSIAFLHSGYGAEWVATDQYGTSYVDRMWSHRWSIPTWTSAEGVTVSAYHISPGLWDVSGSEPGHIGVICHETGHFFGMPDLYDTDGSAEGIGNWCLMAAGSWGFDGSQQNPTHMSAWCKSHLGWLTPNPIAPGNGLLLQNIEDHAEVALVDSGFPNGEYLLLENKKATAFDSAIPEDGLIAWHIDETKGILGFNNVNNEEGYPGQSGWPGNANHYRVALLQADGDYDLENDSGRGDSGDIFTDSAVDELSAVTTPDTDAYQTGNILVNGNRLHNITNSGMDVLFDYENLNAASVTAGNLPVAAVGKSYSLQLSAVSPTPGTWQERYAANYGETDLGSSQWAAVGSAQGWQADDSTWSYALPFSFPFYGEIYDTVYVSSNGFLDFAPVESDPANRIDYLRFYQRIAPLWADLRTDTGGSDDIYIDASVGGQVTIRWVGEEFETGNTINCSVTLYDDGRIRFHYGSGNSGFDPTVGLSAGMAAVEILGTHNGSGNLNNANSLEYDLSGSQLPPGMSITPTGLLTGTPTSSGTFDFDARRTDALQVYDDESFSLTVDPTAPAMNTLSIYPQLVTATDTVTFRNCGGGPGNFALVFLFAVNSTNLNIHISIGQFDGNGVYQLQGNVNSTNLAGNALTFGTIEATGSGFTLSNFDVLTFY
jgi:M6 family metalloprotease-like protein